MRFPYGKVYIDGKWYEKEYLHIGRPRFFTSEDSITLSIDFYDIRGALTEYRIKKGFEFLRGHYDWYTEDFSLREMALNLNL